MMRAFARRQCTPFTFAMAAGLLLGASAAHAQDRLVGLRALSGGAVFEQIEFGDNGMLQPSLTGLDSVRINRASLFTVPVSAAMPLGRNLTMDITTLYSSGDVTITPASGGAERQVSLSGLSDVRVRTTGRFFNDALVFTVGVNAPTGRTELDLEELTALRVLAAPALSMGATPVGGGPSGTVGVLSAQRIGNWAVAAGVAYEYRGTYQPVSAFVAGAPSVDFQPGDVVRLSLGLDGLVGRNRLSLTASGDLFQSDVLRSPIGGAAPLASVQLGPVLGADAQLLVAAPRVRELLLWSAARYRANYARDGVTVENSNGVYVDGGVRTSIPVLRRTDVVFAADGRFHSGLAIDEGLPTAGVTSGTVTFALSQRAGQLSIQPFVRGTAGRVQARGSARDAQQAALTGFAGGLVILTRF